MQLAPVLCMFCLWWKLLEGTLVIRLTGVKNITDPVTLAIIDADSRDQTQDTGVNPSAVLTELIRQPIWNLNPKLTSAATHTEVCLWRDKILQ